MEEEELRCVVAAAAAVGEDDDGEEEEDGESNPLKVVVDYSSLSKPHKIPGDPPISCLKYGQPELVSPSSSHSKSNQTEPSFSVASSSSSPHHRQHQENEKRSIAAGVRTLPSNRPRVEFKGIGEMEDDEEEERWTRKKKKKEDKDEGDEDDEEVEDGRKRAVTVTSGSSRTGCGDPRLRQPRLSLLGKPINYNLHRRDARYRQITRVQTVVYNFLERPKDWKEISYHLLVFLMVFLCLLLSIFSTFEHYETVSGYILYYLEIIMVVWFSAELVVRVWSAGCRSRYQQLMGRLQFIRRPLCVVDVTVISASVIILCLGSSGQVFATSALRGLRFFQILRMVRVDRRGGSWKLLGSVVWAHRQELFTTLYIGFLGLIFSSFLVYLAEKEKNPKKFGTYADALWWGVITLCTVGYGDTVPITWPGKMIAAFCAILGISFFALPAGILGSGFALKVQQQQRQKHLIRRRVPAAALIQALWRCYAADKNSMSTATWKPHLTAQNSPQIDHQKIKSNQSFMSRLSTRRKDRIPNNSNAGNPTLSPVTARQSALRRWHNHNSEDKDSDSIDRCMNLSDSIRSTSNSFTVLFRRNFDYKDSEDDQETVTDNKLTRLTEVQKQVIRSVRKIKYFVARRKFKEALRPYDVKDVIEQYSAGHIDMLTRIKSLQSRLDLILGKAGSKKSDIYDSKISVSSRIVKVEREVEEIDCKLSLLIDMYKEDRKTRRQNEFNSVRAAPFYRSSCSDLHSPSSFRIDESAPVKEIVNNTPGFDSDYAASRETFATIAVADRRNVKSVTPARKQWSPALQRSNFNGTITNVITDRYRHHPTRANSFDRSDIGSLVPRKREIGASLNENAKIWTNFRRRPSRVAEEMGRNEEGIRSAQQHDDYQQQQQQQQQHLQQQHQQEHAPHLFETFSESSSTSTDSRSWSPPCHSTAGPESESHDNGTNVTETPCSPFATQSPAEKPVYPFELPQTPSVSRQEGSERLEPQRMATPFFPQRNILFPDRGNKRRIYNTSAHSISGQPLDSTSNLIAGSSILKGGRGQTVSVNAIGGQASHHINSETEHASLLLQDSYDLGVNKKPRKSKSLL